MISYVLAKVFGTKNERELNRIRPLVDRINKLEEKMLPLTPDELMAKTAEFRERLTKGETLNDLLPEAFAVVREAARRTLNMRHFDVQLIGGIVLHEGNITEMRTGEGKTLVATLPLYLNALEGKGAHLITVNDYLARRDAEWMMPIFHALGMTVGIIQENLSDAARAAAYGSDITYGTNNQYGFDYLRDNMKFDLADYVQRALHFAIVDEVDSILIDEARTPLIISGPAEQSSELYHVADKVIRRLKRDTDYEVDEKHRSVQLTEAGIDNVESALRVDNLYAPENVLLLHHVQQALRAHAVFKLDVEYVVRDGEVLIVDEFTGRILSGRRYSDGLHQALEAKEGVEIERENQTLATITLQNYFRMYKKLAGMSGTAVTDAGEFHNIYKLGVVVIPTHRPISRIDQSDILFFNKKDKFNAVIADIKECFERKQPVLVGTVSVETSEYLSHLLSQQGIPHNVLNAKQHAREADIVAEAGQCGKVTIATNMAGRGTDIKLGEGAREVGGLRIIGTERHDSRRVDNQLRGRAGRQGDPGSSRFYLSLEDDLVRIFAGEAITRFMERIKNIKWLKSLQWEEGESLDDPMLSRSVERAQEKVEKSHFEMRKHQLEYDDVLNQQRTVIYSYRRSILEGDERTQEFIHEMIGDSVLVLFEQYAPKPRLSEEEFETILHHIKLTTGLDKDAFAQLDLKTDIADVVMQRLAEFITIRYTKLRDRIPDQDMLKQAEKWLLLETVDRVWKSHLLNIDHLKEGIGLRGYGFKNPLVEYKKEAFSEFKEMISYMKSEIMEKIFRMNPAHLSIDAIHEIERKKEQELASLKLGGEVENVDADQKGGNRAERRQKGRKGFR